MISSRSRTTKRISPVPPEDIEFWRDVFKILLPPEESDEVSSEQEG
jgi:hypothetical protein